MKEQVNIDEQIKQALQEIEVLPFATSFDTILERVNQKKKRRGLFILLWIGLIAFGTVPVYLYLSLSSRQVQPAISAASIPLKDKMKVGKFKKSNYQNSRSVIKHQQNQSTLSAVKQRSAIGPVFFKDHAHKQYTHHATKHRAKDTVHVSPHLENLAEPFDQFSPSTNVTDDRQVFLSGDSLINQQLQSGHVPDYLLLLKYRSVKDSIQPDIIKQGLHFFKNDSAVVKKKKNDLAFLVGMYFNPQLNSFMVSKNPNRNSRYNTTDDFSGSYLHAKKEQANLRYSTSFGLKAGVALNHTYEFLFSFGYQKIKQEETFKMGIDSLAHIDNSLAAGFTNGDAGLNVFKSFHYALEVNRLYQLSGFFKFKMGIGISANQLIRSDYFSVSPSRTYQYHILSKENLSGWFMTTQLKAGIIFNANKRLQLHMSPGFFYSPTSLFNRDYVIRQKPYGVNLECLLLFKMHRASSKL